MHELYEFDKIRDWCFIPWAIEFLDCPGKIEPEVGDKFLSWYWIPIPMMNQASTYDLEDTLPRSEDRQNLK